VNGLALGKSGTLAVAAVGQVRRDVVQHTPQQHGFSSKQQQEHPHTATGPVRMYLDFVTHSACILNWSSQPAGGF